MIGAFYQPQRVVCDLDTLRTLPPRELRAGLAEVIKYGPIADAAFLAWIEAHLDALLARDADALAHAVRRSCEIKAWVVGQDERESGLRAILNFGHTFGHAIESGLGYGQWLHGEAVACGMVMAADLSARLGLVPRGLCIAPDAADRACRPAGARPGARRRALPGADARRQEGAGRRDPLRADRGAGPGRGARRARRAGARRARRPLRLTMPPISRPGPATRAARAGGASTSRAWRAAQGYRIDRERIVHCTAFRRLVYKTQVFINHEGDLFRTRLTHSLEVAQLARSMARELRLNEDLVEAIALAHDLGHTPFGHAGQDALHDCMRAHGGFEHNLQSLRVVDVLEQCHARFDGLNLSFETREGILKHCSRAHAERLERDEPGGVGQRFLRGPAAVAGGAAGATWPTRWPTTRTTSTTACAPVCSRRAAAGRAAVPALPRRGAGRVPGAGASAAAGACCSTASAACARPRRPTWSPPRAGLLRQHAPARCRCRAAGAAAGGLQRADAPGRAPS